MNDIVQTELVWGEPGWPGRSTVLRPQRDLTDLPQQTVVLRLGRAHLPQPLLLPACITLLCDCLLPCTGIIAMKEERLCLHFVLLIQLLCPDTVTILHQTSRLR